MCGAVLRGAGAVNALRDRRRLWFTGIGFAEVPYGRRRLAFCFGLDELFEPERSVGGTELRCSAIPFPRLGRVGVEIDDA